MIDHETRPRRRMPSMKEIQRHHGLGHVPFCVRCGRVDTYLEKAHIIDRFTGGLDTLANLAPLCARCHRNQPIFSPGDEEAAREWFGLAPANARPVPLAVTAAVARALEGEIAPAGVRVLWECWGTAMFGPWSGLPPHPLTRLEQIGQVAMCEMLGL